MLEVFSTCSSAQRKHRNCLKISASGVASYLKSRHLELLCLSLDVPLLASMFKEARYRLLLFDFTFRHVLMLRFQFLFSWEMVTTFYGARDGCK